MKVGLIVECTLQGLEHLVCPKILQLLSAEVGVPIECRDWIRPMTNKKLLIEDAATTAKILLGQGCDRVVIMWDENPPWTPEKALADEPCWHTEREQLLKNLAAAKINRTRVGLVCIEREFETWLLHDGQLLSQVIGTPEHPVKIKRLPDPTRVPDPKAALLGLFRKHKARYDSVISGRKFAKCLNGLGRLQRCDTFRYFAQAVFGKMPKGWVPYVYRARGPKR